MLEQSYRPTAQSISYAEIISSSYHICDFSNGKSSGIVRAEGAERPGWQPGGAAKMG